MLELAELVELVGLVELKGAATSPDARLGNAEICMVLFLLAAALFYAVLH